MLALGYDLGPKKADGIFGDVTLAAVKSFQECWGLKLVGKDADGISIGKDKSGDDISVKNWMQDGLKGIFDSFTK